MALDGAGVPAGTPGTGVPACPNGLPGFRLHALAKWNNSVPTQSHFSGVWNQ